MVATEDNLSNMLYLKPQVLHISCHGIDKEQGTALDFQGEKKFLLLENEHGEGKLVNQKILNSLITT